MPTPNPQRVMEIRRIIEDFLAARLHDKLEKLTKESATRIANQGGDGANDEKEQLASKIDTLHRQFNLQVWIANAAHRITQIQIVTHFTKPTPPDPRGTSLYIQPADLPKHELVGTCSLGQDFQADAVGNAAALDAYAFLKLRFDERSLLDLMLVDDADLSAVLSDDGDKSIELMRAFTGTTRSQRAAASHTNAKQLYWLVDGDARKDENYHLLAPLFATSLAHFIYQTIYADRFGELSKDTRDARKSGRFIDHVLHDYPNMAVQKLGGTKPQNISQLNSERRGDNYLLASLPPRWKSVDLRPLLNTDSMFHEFGQRAHVKALVKELRDFLQSDPAANVATRNRRDALVGELAGELSMFGAEIRTLLPGWSQSVSCRLSAAERHWLDPDGLVEITSSQSEQVGAAISGEQISQAFGRWLNRQLRDPLPMGDPEYLHWCGLAQAELDDEESE